MHIAHQNDAKSLFMKTVALDFAKKLKETFFRALNLRYISRKSKFPLQLAKKLTNFYLN